MKLHYIVFLQMCLLPFAAVADESFHLPFEGVEAKNVARIEIKVSGVEKSIEVVDRKWITGFFELVTPRDYPITKGPMSFSMPPDVAQITLRDEDGTELVSTILYGPWNLMRTGKGTSNKLGSNRKLAAFILKEIERTHPKKLKDWRKKYRDQISGVYKREYRDVIKSEQDDAVQPATAVDSKAEGNEKAKPESEARSQ